MVDVQAGTHQSTDPVIQEKLMIASMSFSAGGVWFALTDAVSLAIVTQFGALALAALAAFVSWRTHKASLKAQEATLQTHAAVNSRMDEFKAMFAQAKINEGVLLEKAVESKRKGDIADALLGATVHATIGSVEPKLVKADEKSPPA